LDQAKIMKNTIKIHFMRIRNHLLSFVLFMFATAFALQGQVVINEYSVSNLFQFTDNYSRYEDWIELHNTQTVAVNIGGYYLSDKEGNPTKWEFPAGTMIPANGYLLIWASGRNESENGHYHTNFRLSQTKSNPEFIMFSDPSGNILEIQQLQITQLGHSRGRTINGGSMWGVFTNPTPGSSNNAAASYEGYALRPVMNYEAGFYDASLFVSITTDEPNAVIRYTTNGNTPISTSPLYLMPLTVASTSIVQAKVFSNNPSILPSLIEFNTYFINESHELVVLSVSADQILALLNGNANLEPHGTIEYFNTDGLRTNAGYGEYNKHGQDSWVHPQRSIDFIMRDEMGYNNALHEKLFTLSEREEFQRIIIRAEGDDNYPGIDSSAHMRDVLIQNLAQKSGMNLDVRKGSKAVVYANGQYWGVYSIREKVDDHDFTNYYYNQDKYNIQFLKYWGALWAEYGGDKALEDWFEFRNVILNGDVNNPLTFGFIKANYDYTSLVDYVIINSFVVCSDWLNWNVGWWRGLNPDGSHHKWAYILWDEDATFGHYINYTGIPGQHPFVSPCYPEYLSSWSDPQKHIEILNKLRQNPEVEQYYISRYLDLKNTVFVKDDLLQYVDSMSALVSPEMTRHATRWGGSFQEWEDNVLKLRNFIANRCDYLGSGLMSCYDLEGPFDFTLNAEPAGVGMVKLNSLMLETFPWSGEYYGGVDMKLTALATNTAYEFDYWELANHSASPDSTAEAITISPSNWENIVAHFKPKLFTDSLVINEINYRSSSSFDSEDWVEFYNPQEYTLDISGWVFKDDDDSHSFTFPASTIIDPFGYLVLCRDTVKFKDRYPQVSNYIGDMEFGFSSDGELIRLYNQEQVLVDTVHYQNYLPWPPQANGGGSTLELIHPSLDNALPESWMASPLQGTPGAMNSYLTYVPNQPEPFNKVSFAVIPNPATDKAVILIEADKAVVQGSLKLINSQGVEVLQIDNISTQLVHINAHSLARGLYLFRFVDEHSKLIGNGKIVFH
jgi:hypothetical protein